MNLQAIFQSKNGRDGKWLDYCREQLTNVQQAEIMLNQLARRVEFPVRVYVEDWDNEIERLPFDGLEPRPQYPRAAVHAAPKSAFFDI